MSAAALFSLEGRRALVTGGNSGIGEAMAHALGAAGARVLLVARRAAELDAAASRLHAVGVDATWQAADLTDVGALRAAAAAAEQRLGAIDILVNAAGVNLRQPFADVTPEAWQTQLALHLGAPFFLTQALAPGMAARGWGRIVNIASLNALRAEPLKCAYNSAKSGLLGLTRTTAVEGGPFGITAHAICPGLVRTPLVESQIPAIARAHGVDESEVVERVFLKSAPIKRFIEPSEIAALVAFLCSDDASAISGSPILIDQGIAAGV
jgi:gluconate 5-dehydrogenase